MRQKVFENFSNERMNEQTSGKQLKRKIKTKKKKKLEISYREANIYIYFVYIENDLKQRVFNLTQNTQIFIKIKAYRKFI